MTLLKLELKLVVKIRLQRFLFNIFQLWFFSYVLLFGCFAHPTMDDKFNE